MVEHSRQHRQPGRHDSSHRANQRHGNQPDSLGSSAGPVPRPPNAALPNSPASASTDRRNEMSKNSDIYRTAIGRRLVEVEENEEGEVTVVFGSSEDDESVLGVQM